MQKKVAIVFLIIFILAGCGGSGGVRGDGSGEESEGSNNSNSDAVVGALLLIGAGLLWANRDSIFKKDTGRQSEASIPNNVKSTNYRHVYDHTYTPIVSLDNEKEGY